MKALYTCPHCYKQVRDLPAHIARMHPEKSGADNRPEPDTNAQDNDALVIKPPEAKTEAKQYHCINCGTALSYGQNPCPNCGEPLDWAALERKMNDEA